MSVKYYVIEIQTNADGTSGSNIWGFDDRNAAEAKYHTVLMYAAQSRVLVHSAMLMSREAVPLKRESYTHPAEGGEG